MSTKPIPANNGPDVRDQLLADGKSVGNRLYPDAVCKVHSRVMQQECSKICLAWRARIMGIGRSASAASR